MKMNVTTLAQSKLTLMVLPNLRYSPCTGKEHVRRLLSGIAVTEFNVEFLGTLCLFQAPTRLVTLFRIAAEHDLEKLASSGALARGSLVLRLIRIIRDGRRWLK